jgi:hypothetical protein
MPTGVYIRTKEHRRKISLSMKGYKPSAENRRKVLIATISNKYFLNHKHTKDTRKRISLAMKGSQNHLGCKHSVKTKRKMSKSRIKYLQSINGRIFRDPSDIEIAMSKELDRRGIDYIQTPNKKIWVKKLNGKKKLYFPDFYLKAVPILIECDGDYWHGGLMAQIQDRVKDCRLEKEGYKVLRFWGHEINQNIKKCGSVIENEFINMGF